MKKFRYISLSFLMMLSFVFLCSCSNSYVKMKKADDYPVYGCYRIYTPEELRLTVISHYNTENESHYDLPLFAYDDVGKEYQYEGFNIVCYSYAQSVGGVSSLGRPSREYLLKITDDSIKPVVVDTCGFDISYENTIGVTTTNHYEIK